MARFKKSTQHSICGDPFVRCAKGKDHFLFRLVQVVDWDEFTAVFVKAYKGEAAVGEAPYHPLVLFKMLLLSHLFKTSERAVEDLCTWYIPARLFIGLGALDTVPDHSTLSVFRRRVKQHAGISDFAEVFDGIIVQAVARGVRFGSIQIVDSVHTVANVVAHLASSAQQRVADSFTPEKMADHTLAIYRRLLTMHPRRAAA